MKFYTRIFLITLGFIGISLNKPKPQWEPIFNGKNLDGWTPKIRGYEYGNNFKQTFRVHQGAIQVNYEGYNDKFNNAFGHLFYKSPFSHYKLRLDYRFIGEQLSDGPGWATRNSGVMIHCQEPSTMGKDQEFPVSVEVQLLGGLKSGKRPTGNVCTPGTDIFINDQLTKIHCLESNSETYNGDQWVHLEIEVRSDSIIKHFINGTNVLTYYKPQYGGAVDANEAYWKKQEGRPVKGGYISLQSESHPVEFKNIEIMAL